MFILTAVLVPYMPRHMSVMWRSIGKRYLKKGSIKKIIGISLKYYIYILFSEVVIIDKYTCYISWHCKKALLSDTYKCVT